MADGSTMLSRRKSMRFMFPLSTVFTIIGLSGHALRNCFGIPSMKRMMSRLANEASAVSFSLPGQESLKAFISMSSLAFSQESGVWRTNLGNDSRRESIRTRPEALRISIPLLSLKAQLRNVSDSCGAIKCRESMPIATFSRRIWLGSMKPFLCGSKLLL